jgi:hypothetical protein
MNTCACYECSPNLYSECEHTFDDGWCLECNAPDPSAKSDSETYTEEAPE